MDSPVVGERLCEIQGFWFLGSGVSMGFECQLDLILHLGPDWSEPAGFLKLFIYWFFLFLNVCWNKLGEEEGFGYSYRIKIVWGESKMFYSQFILAKKGPLGTIWIAAHLERKLRKNQVADTDIGVSVGKF